MKTNLRQHLLASTLLVGAVAYASPALAQDPATTEDPTAQPPTGPVESQPTPDVSSEGEDVQTGGDIIVTGSRIPQPNLESAAPVTVVSDQDVKLSGSTRIEDVLNQLPSVGAAQASGVSNGATGTAEVDLRYLGAKRTLALVNGRRLMPGDPNSANQSADLNVIPAALIRRVEVLTGGASSVYGADAVAGVVNFIMDTTFEGVRFDGNYSFYWHNQHDPSVGAAGNVSDILADAAAGGTPGYDYPRNSVTDGRAFDGTVTIGSAFDDGRGHAVAYFGYRKVKPILQRDRDFSACSIGGAGANVACAGSFTSAEGNALAFQWFDDDPETPDDDESGNATTTFTFDRGTRQLAAGYTLYNFNPLNYFQRPDERYVAGAFADYEISPALKPYLEFMFMDDRTLAQIAPSGDFGSTFSINCDNPFLTGDTLELLCGDVDGDGINQNSIVGFIGNFPVAAGAAYNLASNGPGLGGTDPLLFNNTVPGGDPYTRAYLQYFRRNVEGGPRISDLKHTAWRGVLGMRGDLNPAFSYDTYFQYGRTNYTQVYKNEFSVSRLNRALDVVDNPNTPEVDPTCRSALDNTDPSCVPYDIFGGPSAAALDYLNIFGVIQGFTSEQVANFNVTGVLGEYGIRTPWAEDGVGVNVGAEYRKESLELNPDQSFQTLPASDLAGQGAPTLPTSGSFRVLEFFAETQIPIVQNNFIDDLSIGLGYRKSGYSLSNGRDFSTNTYKAQIEFAPISDVRFRAAYNRAVRAPNIQELFAPQFVGLDGSTDPCADIIVNEDNPAHYGCIAQGFVDGQQTPGNPAEQYNGLLGGNPDLEPEKATTKTVGVVFQPRFIPNLAVTVDYWNIKLNGAIQGFGADAILADCMANTLAPDAPAPSCALINRDPAGSLWLTSQGFVEDLPNNVGGIKTDGIDVNVAHSLRAGGLGRLSTSFVGSYLRKYVTDNGLTEPYDCAGLYGSICSGGTVSASAPLPKWRHKARVTLATPWNLGLSLQWRYVGKVKHERTSSDETLASAGNPPILSQRVKAQNYLDLSATYDILDRIHLRAGINNLLDNDPPLITASAGSCPAGPCNGNTYPGTWDALGRYVWMGATIDFIPPKRAPLAPPPVVAPPPPPPAPPPATQTCPDGSVILATETCPVPPPPPPPPPPAPERG
jgi:iron complex outermembrane receptor protein